MSSKRSNISMCALLVLLFFLMPSATPQIVYSQAEPTTETEVRCGDIVPGEFINNAEDHLYLLLMQPGESFEVALEPAGDDLKTIVAIYGATGVRTKISGEYGNYGYQRVSQAPKVATGALSARGPYKIRVANTGIKVYNHQDLVNDTLVTDPSWFGGVGVYTLSIGCTKADGSRIEPGDTAQPTPTPTGQTGDQASLVQESTPETLLPFLEVGQTYEIAFGSQTKIMKLVELRNDGWAKVEVESRVGWLNINQVALIIPIN